MSLIQRGDPHWRCEFGIIGVQLEFKGMELDGITKVATVEKGEERVPGLREG